MKTEPQDSLASPSLRRLFEAKIMLVDDDYMMNEVMKTYLEEGGYSKVVCTSDSPSALDTLRRENPDLLLLDLMMPGVSGFDILSAIRADEDLKYLPVIVLTAATEISNKLKALELGASEFLAKPIDPSELLLRVRNSLAFKIYRDNLAYADTVTGLPNRRTLLKHLNATIARSTTAGTNFGVLHFGLDRFKQINDSLGRHVGDGVLRIAAERMGDCLRTSDMVVRFDGADEQLVARAGGDEFAVLLPNLASSHQAYQIAQRLVKSFEAPMTIGRRELFVTASAGIALFPDDGRKAEALLESAESAMNHAKQAGRNRSEFRRRELNEVSVERLDLESGLHRALERKELVLYYQPKVDIPTGLVTGAEALIRWNHPTQGLVPPLKFIGIAEECGLISPIGDWVIQEACRQGAEWARAGVANVAISVNVSGAQMRDDGILTVVQNALSSTGFDPASLVLEVTESTLMRDPTYAIQLLLGLKGLGVGLSIDDFGTGYSSLSYLKQFPLDELKIDRSFVSGLPDDAMDVAIAQAIVALARSLGLKTVAEGVETDRQLAALRGLQCATYQGYFCSPPVPADGFVALALRQNGSEFPRAAA